LRVEINLFATLSAFRPPGTAPASSIVVEIGDGTTLAGLVAALAIPAGIEYLAVVNGQEASVDRPLADGDAVALFPPLMGGAG
jgi:molybdopterin converting factor small subunit